MVTIRRNLVLAGHFAGKTVELRGYIFQNGRLTLEGPDVDIEGLTTYLGRCYQAYPEGSEELHKAQARDAEAQGGNRGKRSIQENRANRTLQQIPSNVPESGGTTEREAVQSEGHDQPSEGETGSASASEDSGSSENQPPSQINLDRLRKVVMGLDPENDAHWTKLGLPAMDTVEQLYGSAGVLRSDVEFLTDTPWDREAAAAKKAENGKE